MVFVLCLILVLLYQNDWRGFNCFYLMDVGAPDRQMLALTITSLTYSD